MASPLAAVISHLFFFYDSASGFLYRMFPLFACRWYSVETLETADWYSGVIREDLGTPNDSHSNRMRCVVHVNQIKQSEDTVKKK